MNGDVYMCLAVRRVNGHVLYVFGAVKRVNDDIYMCLSEESER